MATLISGSAVAQAIPVAISPILTRIYTPQEFGIFATYLGIVAIASVLVTGRYELAIVLPEDDEEARRVAALSLLLTLVVSFLLLFIVIIYSEQIAQMLGSPAIRLWLYWVPASTLLAGAYQTFNYWNNRKASYKRMAASRVVQGGSISFAQLASGASGVGGIGLLAGQLGGQLIATCSLAWITLKSERANSPLVESGRLLQAAKKYIGFPQYLIVAHGFSSITLQMPVFLLGAYFSAPVAGFYSLTQRVLGAPSTVVAGALGDVFRQEASRSYAQNGRCDDIYRSTFRKLLGLSLVPALIFFFAAPSLFPILFGSAWRISGEFAQILTPVMFVRFITSPLSSMYLIAQRQKLDLAWQVMMAMVVFSSFWLARLSQDPIVALKVFSVSASLAYLINGVVSYQLAKGPFGSTAR